MEKADLIVILKRLLDEEDLDFLQKLDENELAKLVMAVREKIGLSKGLH